MADIVVDSVKFGFGQAMFYLKQGRAVARSNWNGKGSIFLMKGSYPANDTTLTGFHINGVDRSFFECGQEDTVVRMPCLAMNAADGSIVTGWLASQTDMLAEDWSLLAVAKENA